MDRRMQALDDEFMDHVSGGVGFFRTLFGDGALDGMDGEPPAPTPTASKQCFGPRGRHEYPNGSNVCIYCHRPREQ